MNAKWLISATNNGINLTYHNLVDGIIFDCGTTNRSDSIQDFLDFAVVSGAAEGDGVFVDGVLMFTFMEKAYGQKRPQCN